MSKIRYLIVHKDHALDPEGVNSGAEMATRCLAKELVRQGCTVIVAAQLPRGDQFFDGVEYWDLGPGFEVGQILERMSAAGPYHLISAGRAQALLESRSDSHCVSRVLITHDRAGNDTGIKPEILSHVADAIVCVSHAQREVFIRAGANPEKCHVLHNGVELDLFQPGNPETRDYRKLVFVGALVEDKGIHWLVESFCQLKSRFPDITLDVYGSSSLWGRDKLFDEKTIQQQVPGIVFHGKVSQQEIATAYRTAGLCVIPSIWFDPFPLVALEAQACGCPVWAFDVGGLKEGFWPGETGILCSEIKPHNLTAGIAELLAAPERLKAMSQQALLKSRPRFTWEKVATAIRNLSEPKSSSAVSSKNSLQKSPIGFLSTWNQACGLATYGKFMMSEFQDEEYIVLAEDLDEVPTAPDGKNVIRCWKRGKNDFSRLKAVIKEKGIKLLHINCQARFFPQPAFGLFLQSVRQEGVKVVALIHSVFTYDQVLGNLVKECDQVIVHSPEVALECIANGASPEKVRTVPHGVRALPALSDFQRQQLRQNLSMPLNKSILVAFGFVQAHKGMEGIIEGVAHLQSRGLPAHGYIVGNSMPGDPTSAQYREYLGNRAQELGISASITFLDRFVSDEEVTKYLQAADVVLMNYRSQHYEASGACSLAVGAGAVVAASLAPPFVPFANAVWHLTSGFPVILSLELLLTNQALRHTIRKNAESYSATYSWSQIAGRLRGLYKELGFEPSRVSSAGLNDSEGKENVVEYQNANKGSTSLRVLMQNRPNAWTQPGGDTVVMDKTVQALRARGVDVVVDLEGKQDPAQFDVVHLFNFALPDWLKQQAEKAHRAGKPFVVTTLCEDVPRFHTQSHEIAARLVQYVNRGSDKEWLRSNWIDIRTIQPSGRFQNDWVASNAAALLANGASEQRLLNATYSGAKTSIVPVGFDPAQRGDPELFVKEYGVRDFVLVVGRLESRKNQLMLLKALEDSEIPVVLAGGGFSYQPEYEQAARNFKRRGKTIVVGRLSPQMLASAYAACRVHALTSWYELPGLVSLEAAWQGKNVVVTATGTTEDYFSEQAFYCEPDNWRSIKNAVVAAYHSPVSADLQRQVAGFSWEAAADATLAVYQQVAGKRISQQASTAVVTPNVAAISNGNLWTQDSEPLVTAGEDAAKEGDYKTAHEKLSQAEGQGNNSSRLLRARGTVFLAEGQSSMAQQYFRRALSIDSRDAKSLCGLGMCLMNNAQESEALQAFVHALEIDPGQLTAIHQLVRCAYQLNRYDELEKALRQYLAQVDKDPEIQFCLAGCLYKSNRAGEALPILEQVLAKKPDHRGASELKAVLEKEKPATKFETTAQAIPTAPSWMSPSTKPDVVVVPVAVTKEPSTAPTTSMNGSQAVNGVYDSSLAEVEELKRQLKLEEAGSKCDEVLKNSALPEYQRDNAVLLRAEIHAMLGEVEASSKGFEDVLAKHPRSARALCGRGALNAHAGRWEDAKKCFADALAVQSNYDVALAGLGLCAAQAQKREEAWQYYLQATKSNPENLRAILGLVEIAYPLKRHRELEQVLRQYLEMHPADLQFLYSLAGSLYAQERYAEADSELGKILVFEPGHERAKELHDIIVQKLGAAGQRQSW